MPAPSLKIPPIIIRSLLHSFNVSFPESIQPERLLKFIFGVYYTHNIRNAKIIIKKSSNKYKTSHAVTREVLCECEILWTRSDNKKLPRLKFYFLIQLFFPLHTLYLHHHHQQYCDFFFNFPHFIFIIQLFIHWCLKVNEKSNQQQSKTIWSRTLRMKGGGVSVDVMWMNLGDLILFFWYMLSLS